MNCLLRYMIVVLALLLPLDGTAEDSTLFNRLDADKSGHLSKDELLNSDLVVVTDAKGQKQLTHRDLVKETEAAAVTEEQKHRFFEHHDQDENGYLSSKEWSRASPDGFVLWRF